MNAPAPIIECVPVISDNAIVWTFFRTDIDDAGQGHGRCRLAEFSSPEAARRFSRDVSSAGNSVVGLERLVAAGCPPAWARERRS